MVQKAGLFARSFLLDLKSKLLEYSRQAAGQVQGGHGVLRQVPGAQVPGPAVEPHRAGGRLQGRRPLTYEGEDHPRQHVAAAAARQPGVAGAVFIELPVGCGDPGAVAFEDDDQFSLELALLSALSSKPRCHIYVMDYRDADTFFIQRAESRLFF